MVFVYNAFTKRASDRVLLEPDGNIADDSAGVPVPVPSPDFLGGLLPALPKAGRSIGTITLAIAQLISSRICNYVYEFIMKWYQKN